MIASLPEKELRNVRVKRTSSEYLERSFWKVRTIHDLSEAVDAAVSFSEDLAESPMTSTQSYAVAQVLMNLKAIKNWLKVDKANPRLRAKEARAMEKP